MRERRVTGGGRGKPSTNKNHDDECGRGGSGIRGQFVDGCFAEPRPVRGERERARANDQYQRRGLGDAPSLR